MNDLAKSPKNPAYHALADMYESLMEVDYDRWADYIVAAIREFSPGKTGADVGCGSGAFTRRIRRAGFDVTGFDVSEEMLSVAMKKAREEGLNVTFVRQDARLFKPLKKPDFITALTDLVNYLDPEDAAKTFKKFASALPRGGLLIFDISTEYKIKNIIADNMFGEDGEDFSYLWFNRPFDGGVEMEISTFRRTDGGLYEKSEERHVQYIHTFDSVCSARVGAGFDLVRAEGHLGEEITETTERINFFAVKK
ncbi:MAG: class I SAM-dependent methyltransferase [Clostridia bacterium]|nr:class I SAM-dependent methyltransferase [Clostridia bacterium]